MRKLQKVKSLLRAGKSKSFIAKSLSLTKYRVDKLVEELIETNMKQSKGPSRLVAHDKLIQNHIKKGSNVRDIYKSLVDLNEQVHYSTVARYVRVSKSSKTNFVLSPVPGEITYLFLIRIGGRKKEKKREVYLFCMMLGYSHYSFFAPINDLCLWSFLRIHVAAFGFFGGCSKTIKFCEVSGFHLTENEMETYRLFLAHYGSQPCDSPAENENICREHTHKIKKDILSELFQQDFKRILKTVKLRYARPFNLQLHAITKRSILKEFKQTEQANLLPLPEYGFPLPAITDRKVSKRGFLFYRYRQYRLPDQYKGQTVQVMEEEMQIKFISKGEMIAAHRSLRTGKIDSIITTQTKFAGHVKQATKPKN